MHKRSAIILSIILSIVCMHSHAQECLDLMNEIIDCYNESEGVNESRQVYSKRIRVTELL
ncbi:hypothetical protein THOM_2755 [Trachipleistophora hominis]|uniref:Transposable element encoded protein n=1 Tax=Trachipleistophora hominis TaxID=72359 RepID=L7JU92_TRAHO|nr:hypothetical protein THOM_2755 [Trachipleistophora hominis]